MSKYRIREISLIIGITFGIAMSGCGPSQEEIHQTQVGIIATSNAKKTDTAATRTAAPSSTPRPPSTADTRSPFDKCKTSGRGVRYVVYEISGSVSAVSLTLKNDNNGTDQGDYKLPYCSPYSGFNSGDFVYISAQIIRPTSGAGQIRCEIWSGTNLIASANASGFASIASCSGSVP